MENKTMRIVTLILVFVAFLGVAFLVIGQVDTEKLNDKIESQASMNNYMMRLKNAKIKTLTEQFAAQQKDLKSVKQDLANAKRNLDTANQKLTTITTPTPVLEQAKQ